MIELLIALCAVRLVLYILCSMLRSCKRNIDRIKANCLPYEPPEPEQPEQKPPETVQRPVYLYDSQKEQEKQERIERKERERIQREREKQIKRDRANNLARFDAEYWEAYADKLKDKSAELEKRRAEETGERTIEDIDRQLEQLDRQIYAADRKRIIAQDKII